MVSAQLKKSLHLSQCISTIQGSSSNIPLASGVVDARRDAGRCLLLRGSGVGVAEILAAVVADGAGVAYIKTSVDIVSGIDVEQTASSSLNWVKRYSVRFPGGRTGA